jgi:periplasmic nitrate reductase NapD
MAASIDPSPDQLARQGSQRGNRMNVCGCVVETRVQDAQAVAQALVALPGVGLHASEGGKLVVTVEDTPEAMAVDTLAALGHVAGVLNTSLIYHYGGDEPLEDGEREYQSA